MKKILLILAMLPILAMAQIGPIQTQEKPYEFLSDNNLYRTVATDEYTLQILSDKGGQQIPTLPVARAAEEFESLRLETEGAKKQPVAFMLTIGNLAMRIARAQFSCNFLACAGYKVIDNNGFATIAEGIKAARKAKADIIVLCSSDDEYADLAPKAWKKLQGKKELFIVAGAPACMEDLQKLGITNFIHVRCNVLDTLKALNAQLLKK